MLFYRPFGIKGGAEDYLLANVEWKSDIIPEIMDGKNIADFIDPDIVEKLEALEREEEVLEAEGFYDDHGDMVSSCVRGICVSLF
jgi:nucleolar GTP-binding protein